MSTKTWTNEETFTFIELYQNESAIWNPKNHNHKNKHLVNDCWQRISDEMGISIETLKKKKESLMTSFRTILKKKKMSISRAVDEEDIYKPIWIFYDAMEAFLLDVYPCDTIFNGDESTVKVELIEEGQDCSAFLAEEEMPALEPPPPKAMSRKRRYVNPALLHEINNKIDTTFMTLNGVLNKINENEDECSLYGRIVGMKLREFSSLHRDELMYEIDGLIVKKRREALQ